MKRTAASFWAVATLFVLGSSVIGCGPKPPIKNNSLEIDTRLGRVNHTGTNTFAPFGSQQVAGQWVGTIGVNSVDNPNHETPVGSVSNFALVTTPDDSNWVSETGWRTYIDVNYMEMPAYWDLAWSHPSYCLDSSGYAHTPIPNPYTVPNVPFLYTTSQNTFDVYRFDCFTNDKSNPDFVPTNVSPQFILDDAIPTTLQVAAFDPISAAPSITNLHIFGTNLSNPANLSAISVASDGSSAVFPYPRQSNGSSLPSGAYITTITTDPSGSPQTTNGMEPFYVAHNDTSYPTAFGVAVATPTETDMNYFSNDEWGDGTCLGSQLTSSYVIGGTPKPLVTLLTQGKLAIGNSSTTVNVGSNPTVVIPFNDFPLHSEYTNVGPGNLGACIWGTQDWVGAQSALVVNTGSASVSVVPIGTYNNYPTGTISVGNHPIAAVINGSETMAYIANYDDGTISEVDLNALIQTRTIRVMDHPASVAFDSNGNLWVGGQGAVMNVDVFDWLIASSTPVNGTVNGMSYDTQQGVLVQTVLQNGNSANVAAGGTTGEGATGSNPVVFNATPGQSYSTQGTFSVATLGSATSTSSTVMGDNAAYAQSYIASNLAFPGQTAFSPPIYSATNGDIIATVNGTSFTVSILGTGQVLIQGILPYPSRGVALTPTTVYFTMPESNSLVSLPIQLP